MVEIDETYLGGANSNRHWNKKVPQCQGRSGKDKIPVLVMEERGGNAIAQVASDVKQKTLEPIIRANIKEGANVFTDEWRAYNNLGKWYNHRMVNHRKKEYVNGKASTNLVENFNSHFKKLIDGTYHWISRKHSQKYVDEFVFHRNTRKFSEQERFELILQSSLNNQLTYQELIG